MKNIYKILWVLSIIMFLISIYNYTRIEKEKAMILSEAKGLDKGYKTGYDFAVNTIIEGSADCKIVGLKYQGKEVLLADVDCMARKNT